MVRSGSSRDPLLLRNWREERAGASAIHQRNGVWRRARTSAVLLAVLGCAAAVLALVVAASIAGAGDTVELVCRVLIVGLSCCVCLCTCVYVCVRTSVFACLRACVLELGSCSREIRLRLIWG